MFDNEHYADLMWNTGGKYRDSALPGKFNLYFSGVFPNIDKIFILGRRLSTRLWFYQVLRFSWYFLISSDPHPSIVRQLVRQLAYTMFITNIHASFQLWWKENLVKLQKVSKYYDHDCLQNFIWLLRSWLTAPIVKSSHILVRVYFIFLKKRRRPNLEVFKYKILTSVKRSEKELSSKTNFSTSM